MMLPHQKSATKYHTKSRAAHFRWWRHLPDADRIKIYNASWEWYDGSVGTCQPGYGTNASWLARAKLWFSDREATLSRLQPQTIEAIYGSWPASRHSARGATCKNGADFCRQIWSDRGQEGLHSRDRRPLTLVMTPQTGNSRAAITGKWINVTWLLTPPRKPLHHPRLLAPPTDAGVATFSTPTRAFGSEEGEKTRKHCPGFVITRAIITL